ncbi:MAG: IS110 family transposase [Gammaproteobacteria bacterium]|nr:IS110 family transposase [Gammaproteobacteria bacterium]
MQAIHEALTSIAGIADTSAVSVLAELLVLPTSMSARACTSHAGLDVRTYQSGHSVQRPARISKHGNKYLRRALFLPALSNARHDPHANQFKQRLLDRGKPKMQANVAIMRKLLTVCWAMVKKPQPYDGSKLYHTPKEA